MEKIQNNLAEEVLAHHGILGMKWGIRRYQPYPSDYSGDGKYMGKRMEKKLAKIEKKKARHQAKIDTKIKNAVEDGDKKALKKLRDEIEPAEYEKKYEETVQNGIDNAVKDRDKSALKKYKEDMTPREYKHEQDRIEFKESIDKDKNRKTKKLLSKVDPEDVKEATELIRSRIALQDQKLNKIRQDSELMAKLDKLNSGISKVSKTMSTASSITKSAMDISKTANEFTKEAAEKKKQKEIEKIVRSGNLEEIRKNEKRMTTSQLAEAYNRILQTGSEKEVREAAPFMSAAQVTQAVQKFGKLNELKASEAKPDTGVRVIENFMDTRGTTLFSDVQNSRSVRETSEYLQEMVESNAPIRNLFNRDDVEVQSLFRLSHCDDYDEVLAHHGILGMKWGVRRYQNKDGSLTAAGKKRYFGEDKLPTEEGKEYIAKSAQKYAKKSKTLKDLNKKRNEFETRRGELNYFANKHASKVTKIRPEDHMHYLMSDDPDKVKKAVQYLDAGHKYMHDAWKSSKMDEKYREIKNLQRQFESETRSFVNNILGEYGDTKLSDPMAIKFDTKTKKIMQQTLSDAETIKISMMYAGLWDVD